MEKLTLKESTIQNDKEEREAERKDENHKSTQIESLSKEWRYAYDHSKDQIIGNPS